MPTESKFIPLSVPVLSGQEWRSVKKCFDSGWISSVGPEVSGFEEDIAKKVGVAYAVACINGTSALHIALKILGVGLGDEVIVPTVTFIAPINAVTYVGGHPVFMDCDEFYNIDVEKTIDFIEKETVLQGGISVNRKSKKAVKAIIPTHIFGNAVNLEALLSVCRKRNIKVIEDATESLGTYYSHGKFAGKYTGTIGDVGCYSFNGNKIISAGGGGMMIMNDVALAKKAKYLTTQAKEDGPGFEHHEIGYNYRLNNIQACLGRAQLKLLDKYVQIKKANFDLYKKLLKGISGLSLALSPTYAKNNHWMYALRIDEKVYGRSVFELIDLFKSKNIETRPLWGLSHTQKPFKTFQAYNIELAPKLYRNTLNLPCSVNLKEQDIKSIVGHLKSWKK
jgi:perosamine synthetase